MSRCDWYRNEDWNEEIEAQFVAKLKRSRRKEQYLRIQAYYLAEKKPDVSLRLLDQYFDLGDHFGLTQAYCTQALAFQTQDKLEEAAQAYILAIKRESEYPNVLTNAFLDYSILVAMNGMKEHFAKANNVLDENTLRVIFPVQHFLRYAAKAILESLQGNNEASFANAKAALEKVQIKDSGLPYHKNLGLVSEKHKKIIKKLEAICKKEC